MNFFLGLLLAFIFWMLGEVKAEWKPQYADASPDVQAWYKNAELTEEAQKRFTFKSCCAKSDVFRTRFKVNQVNGSDEWWYFTKDGRWKLIPADIIHGEETAPDGQPTLFIYQGQETCFYVGRGGT